VSTGDVVALLGAAAAFLTALAAVLATFHVKGVVQDNHSEVLGALASMNAKQLDVKDRIANLQGRLPSPQVSPSPPPIPWSPPVNPQVPPDAA